MTTMVKRIAAEIADMDIGDGVTLTVALTPWLLSPTKPPPVENPVEAAIRAIVREVLTEAREPTDDMRMAEIMLAAPVEIGETWRAMVDAALKEGQ
jgi:hypothetical protein